MRSYAIGVSRFGVRAVLSATAFFCATAVDVTPARSQQGQGLRYRTAVADDYAVVGAPWHDGFRGAAYVMKRDGDEWVEVQRLSPQAPGSYDLFGSAVAIDNDVIVVGAPWHGLLRGAAYVYRRDGDRWVLETKLTATDGPPDARFGSTVSLESGTLVVTGHGKADGTGATAAYRFERADGTWRVSADRPISESEAQYTAAQANDNIVAALRAAYGDPPAPSMVPPDPPATVIATSGVFESRVEVSWSSVNLEAFFYKIYRDNVLLSVASADDSLYIDETGVRGVVYDYCVTVVDMNDEESAQQCDTGSRIIFPPALVSASDGELIDGVQITWDDRSAVEAGYILRRDGAVIDSLDANSQSAMDLSAVTSTVYSYEVVAFDDDGSLSVAVSDDGFRGIVLPPLGVSASDGQFVGTVNVTWTDQNSGDDFFIVSRKNLTTMDSTVLDTTALNAESYSDNSAQTGTRYKYCVTAMDLVGQLSVPMCDEGGIDFPPPTDVAASDSTFDDKVEITWVDATAFEDGFRLTRDGVLIATLPPNAESYNDEDAIPDSTHSYCVIAFSNDGGESAPACDDGYRSIVLAPTDVSATDGRFEDRTDITWQSTSTTVVLFKIFRDGVLIRSVGPDRRFYSDTGGTANQAYVYAVQAVAALGDGSVAVSDPGRRELMAPSGVGATDGTFEDRVEIAWTDNSAIESGFAVYRAPAGGLLPGTLIGESGANVTSFVDRTGVPGTSYVYSVVAFDTDGEARGESDADDDEGRRVLKTPGDVSASDGLFEDRVEVLWEDLSNVEDGYNIYRNDVLIGSTADNTTSFFDMTPMLGETSSYAVRAYDAFGTSVAGADSGSTTVLAPASLNASDTYLDRIELRWVDVSEIEDGYILSTDSAGITLRTDTLSANATSRTDMTAIPGVTYDYRLRAFAATATSNEVEESGVVFVPQVVTSATEMDLKIRATDRADGDGFGAAVAMSGDLSVIGAPGSGITGAAYAFKRNVDGTWAQDTKFPPPVGFVSFREIGKGAAVAGDRAMVTVRTQTFEVGPFDRATVFAYKRRPNGSWVGDFLSVGTFPSPVGDELGASVAVSGSRAIIGAQYNAGTGTATMFARPDTIWNPDGTLTAGDAVAGDRFGASVSVSGDWAIVGAFGQASNLGAAYVFRRDTVSTWTQVAKLVASDGQPGDLFGFSVGISGDRAIVGAPNVDGTTGAVYAFTRGTGDIWIQEAKLTASDGAPNEGFGASVSIDNDRGIVGSRGANGGMGAAYLFARDPGGDWAEVSKLIATDGDINDALGGSVAVNGNRAIVGAPGEGVNIAGGSAYAIELVATPGNVSASDGTFEDRVHIVWDDRSLNEEGFIIYRDGVEYDRVDADEQFYDDFAAEPGQTYEYAVSALNGLSGFESARVPDFGRRPTDGAITGRITANTGGGVPGVSVCLDPPGTGALLFDGVGGHVRIPDDGTFNFTASEDFSIEVWIKYAAKDRSPRVITKLSEFGAGERPIDLGLQRSGRLFFVMSDGDNFARVLSNRADLNDDKWHHVACVHDASMNELRLYIDSVFETSASTINLGDITNDSDLFIGGFGDATWFGGQIDDLRIWDFPRSEANIVADGNRPLEGTEAGLIGYWPFDALSGRAVTDFAGEAQYGEFVDGVYRTSEAAPLDVCDVTDEDGNFALSKVRYRENGTDFRVRPTLPRHEFSPPVQIVTLNAGHPVENQVNFTDVSSFTLAGRVQFESSPCFEADVQLLLDGERGGVSDKNGKFAVTADEGRHTIRAVHNDYTFSVVFEGDTIQADSLTLDVTDDVSNLLFLNTTKHVVSGDVGGGCDRYVGDITLRFRSESNCLDTLFIGNPNYSIDLPPRKYFASATVDPATIPSGLSKSDVVSFFQSLGERELDLTAVADTTMDFIYRAPLRVVITGFEPYQTCTQLVLEDGTPLPPNLPIVPQLEMVDLVIRVEEDYGTSVCPLDTGMVVITDEIFDQEDSPDTLTVSGGIAEYTTFASTPSLVAGRTEGSNNRSFQKAITATAIVEGREPTPETEWVLVTGRVAPPGSEFITFSTNMPLHILRDPPGDGSSAFLEKGFTLTAELGFETSLTLETGVELKTEFGFKPSTFVGAGIGAFAGTINSGGGSAVLENKFIIGSTITAGLKTQLTLTTKERFSTSSNDALVGEAGDVFIGAGVNFLFTEAGTIEVDENCRVIRGTVAAFEPDSVKTAYAFTETHIADVLIPELDDKAELFADSLIGDVFAAERDNWIDILDRNRSLKINALTTENRSFSAGADFEYTHQIAGSAALGGSLKLYTSLENKLGTDVDVNIFGAKVKVTIAGIFNIRAEVTTSAGGSIGTERVVGYTLSDDDIGDNFTVDILDDGEFIAPAFRVLGGKSSCPYEPWPDPDTGDPSMVARDRLALRIDPQKPADIPPPDEPAVLKLTLENQSDETRDYELRSLSVSNPGGAILKVNGSPIASGLGFTIAPESVHEATLTVERGPSRFFYENLQLALAPACGDPGIEDVVTFNVAFQTECSGIALFAPESGWEYNKTNADASDTIEMILTDYEKLVSPVDSLRVTAVGVQYRRLGVDREGPDPWTDVFADSVGEVETLVAWLPPAEAPDGVYEIRAFAQCNTGGRGYSDVATGTIDRAAPLVFGTPEPGDGELSLGEDIRVAFNEPIDCASADTTATHLTYLDGPQAGNDVAIASVCNGEAIVIVPLADPNDLEGRRLRATVSGIRDLVGNTMEAAVAWEFEYRQSLFTWSETRLTQEVSLGTPGSVATDLVNGTSDAVDYEVTQLPAFLTVAVEDATGRLAAGERRTVPFAVDEALTGGIHEGQILVQAVNTAGTDTVAVAALDVTLTATCTEPAWAVDPGGFEHSMTVIAQVDAGGALLTQPDDRLAAFVGGQLRGVASPEPAGSDTLFFLTVYSSRTANETVRFEVWDDDACTRYPSTVERLAFIADDIVGSTAAPFSLTAAQAPPASVGVFPLAAGWNWFSTNVLSVDMSVVEVLSSLSPSAGDVIKSKTAFAIFDPDTTVGWVGSLTTLDNTSGYMIRLAEAGTVLQEGTAVDPAATAIPIDNGWNWLAYLPNTARSVTDALADLSSQGLLSGGEVMKGQTAFAQWDGAWLGSLGTLQTGQGYRLFLQNGALPGTFNYPANPVPFIATAGRQGETVTPQLASVVGGGNWSVEPARYQYNMTVVAVITTRGTDWHDDADRIGAFVDGECRALANPIYVEGLDRHIAFITVHSNDVSGETVRFRAYDANARAVYDIPETMPFSADAMTGTLREPRVLATSEFPDEGIPSALRLEQNHPNPFNPSTTIRFDIPRASHVELAIYNVRGQLVRRLVDRNYEPGFHRVTWDAKTSSGRDAASGVYFYRLIVGDFTDVKKMVLLR